MRSAFKGFSVSVLALGLLGACGDSASSKPSDAATPDAGARDRDSGREQADGGAENHDAGPQLDSAVPKVGQAVDLNGDGIADGVLVDVNGDGLADGVDTNGDGVPDFTLTGLPWSSTPDAAAPGVGALVDFNGDGIPDGVVIDTNGDGLADAVDTNGDGVPDLTLTGLPWLAPDWDAGATEDGGRDAGHSGPGATCVGSVVACTTAGGESGYQVCSNGAPVGECRTIADLFDASAPSSDASMSEGDAGGAYQCPSSMECSRSFASVVEAVAPTLLPPGFSVCAGSGAALPPTCVTGGATCHEMGLNGTCTSLGPVGNLCLQPCPLN